MLFLYALAKVTKTYMLCRRQMISDREWCDVGSWPNARHSFCLQFGLFSFEIRVRTCKCARTRQLKPIQEVCPHFLKSLGLFKAVPRVRMSHWPHNGPQWQPVLRPALIAGECHSGRVSRFIFAPRRGPNPLCRPPHPSPPVSSNVALLTVTHWAWRRWPNN